VNKFERYSIVAGIALSAVSAVASAYAAWQTKTQAAFAQQALTASDLNRTFEAFYGKWSDLCQTIDVTDGYIGFDLRSIQNHQMIVVDATDLGYSFEALDRPSYRRKVIHAMDEAVAAHDRLTLWLPSTTIDSMRFNEVLGNLIVLSRVDVSEPDARRYNAMLKQIGYCRIWKTWFMGWFKEGYPPAPDIDYKNVRLVFRARDGGLLNDEYIRESRSLPWNEIHKFAPP
jgi:hypothetical protein